MICNPPPQSANILASDSAASMARSTRRQGKHVQPPCHVALLLAATAALCFGGSSFHLDAEAFQLRRGRDLLAAQDPASAIPPAPPSPPSNPMPPPPPTNQTTPAVDGSMSTRASASAGPVINQDDWSVLRFLKFSVGGGVYVFPELVSWRATAACNDFYGVTCNSNGRVVSIELDNMGLNGTILPLPLNSGYPNLGTMAFLRSASFKNNVLSGGIPTFFRSNLTSLDLSSNKFNVTLPNNFIAPGLQFLNLSNNAFRASPQGFNGFLSRLTSLRSLSISSNRLTGGLPTAVGPLRLLSSMVLDHNALTGPLVPQLSTLTSLQTLDLSYNALSGQIISQLGNLKSLRFLDLTSNDLAGSIPAALSSCSSLNQLLTGQNMLSALPPPALSEIKQLRVLNVSFNLIAAQLPAYIATYSALQTLDMQSNALMGTVLDSFSSVRSLGHINLKHNKLSGTLPSSLGRLSALSYLNLGYNSITGVIPNSFATLLKNALYVYLDHNKLYGEMPSGTTAVPAFFDVSFNQLTGKLPPGASNGPYAAPWLYNVAYNYFIASSQVVVSGRGVQFCPNQNFGYSPFVGYFGSLAKNCISSSSSGRCLPEAQRRPAACAAFCGTTSAAGACGGNGYCYLQGPNLLPTCLCFSGYQRGETRDSCVRAGSAALATAAAAAAVGTGALAVSDGAADGSATAAPGPAPVATDVGPVDVDAGGDDTNPTLTATAVPPGGYSTGYKLQPTTASRQFLAPFFRYAALGASAQRLPSWSVPSNWNWQRFFASGPGNQGSCGSSWAFATTQAISIVWNQTYRGPAQDLSVQQVIACQGSVCSGANTIDALEYVGRITTSVGRTGLTTAAKYPYKGQAQPACQTNLANQGTQGLTQYEAVQFGGWLGLVLALQKLPVIVALQATAATFQSYMGGFVYVDAGCYTGVPNHAVAVVGYSLTAATPFFVLRNSWGTGWGEGGYMRIGIAPGDGVCGMLAGPGYIPLVPGADVCGAASAPCGSGECVPRNSSAAPYTVNTCKTCPPGFASVVTFTGIQECAPINICKMQAFNPCGVGTCLPFTPNKYTCQCPPGYNFVTLAATNTATCVPNANAPAGTYCQAFYSVSGDQEMCSSIAQRFNITLNNIFEWNGGIACFYPLAPGLSVCVRRATFKPAVRACTSYYGVQDQDTCMSVVKLQRPPLTTLDLYRLNPGVMCQTLTPNITSGALSQGTKVCVADVAAPVACGSGGTYRVVAGDSCPVVLSKAFGGSPASLAAANNGLVCDDRRLFVGQVLCRP